LSTAPHLLAQTPLLTISWQPSSEAFGRWNVVYEQAKTLCESVVGLLRETAPESVKDHVATCALAGIIAKTKHFRTDLVTPHMLTVCADLVAAGAERLKIIEELYRTRSVDTLRLWGAACARLQEVTPGVLFSELTEDDFLRTHTSPDALHDIAQEVLQSSDKTHEILFFYPLHEALHVRVVAKRPRDARAFLGALRTEGTRDSALHVFAKEMGVRDVIEKMKATAS
jgi:nanoRNase/pAp phosphatase (c-di-AMP/oligoRNAs hydrolase)